MWRLAAARQRAGLGRGRGTAPATVGGVCVWAGPEVGQVRGGEEREGGGATGRDWTVELSALWEAGRGRAR